MSVYHRIKITDPFKVLLSNINASQFFPNYAPNVKNWRAKLAGNDGKGIPVYFFSEDIEDIKKGLQKMSKDFAGYIHEKQLVVKQIQTKENSRKK